MRQEKKQKAAETFLFGRGGRGADAERTCGEEQSDAGLVLSQTTGAAILNRNWPDALEMLRPLDSFTSVALGSGFVVVRALTADVGAGVAAARQRSTSSLALDS